MIIEFKYFTGPAPRLEAYHNNGNKIAEASGLSKRHAEDNIRKVLVLKRDVDNCIENNTKKKKKNKIHRQASILNGVGSNAKKYRLEQSKIKLKHNKALCVNNTKY